MTTRDIQREETKKRIYDVAFKLFDEFGYDKVKVSDIAKAANVSVGSVYYHYKNKEAIIDYGYYEFDQMLKEAYEKQSFDNEREAILFLIDFQIKDVFLDIGLKMTTICFKNSFLFKVVSFEIVFSSFNIVSKFLEFKLYFEFSFNEEFLNSLIKR